MEAQLLRKYVGDVLIGVYLEKLELAGLAAKDVDQIEVDVIHALCAATGSLLVVLNKLVSSAILAAYSGCSGARPQLERSFG